MKRAVTFLFSLVLTLVLCEGAVRVFMSVQEPNTTAYFCNCDSWWQLRWHIKAPRVANRVMWMMEPDPETGWRLKPGLKKIPRFDTKFVSTNAQGARAPQDFVLAKDPKRIRVAILGDSYAFGFGVNEEETFGALLAKRFPRLEVMNFAVEGYGHDQMFVTLQRRVAEYRPDIVLLGFTEFDRERNVLNFREYAKPRFHSVAGRLELESPVVPTPDVILKRERWTPRLYHAAKILACHVANKEQVHQTQNQLAAEIITAIVTTSRQLGAQPVLAHLPINDEVIDRRERPLESETFLKTICTQAEADCVFTRNAFRAALNRGEPRFITNQHWKVREHATAALELGDYFADLIRRWPRDSKPVS